jgi:hypothetical protein
VGAAGIGAIQLGSVPSGSAPSAKVPAGSAPSAKDPSGQNQPSGQSQYKYTKWRASFRFSSPCPQQESKPEEKEELPKTDKTRKTLETIPCPLQKPDGISLSKFGYHLGARKGTSFSFSALESAVDYYGKPEVLEKLAFLIHVWDCNPNIQDALIQDYNRVYNMYT